MISGNKSFFSVDDLLSNAFAMYDGGRRGLPMYDVRRTMYDLDYSAPKARAMRSFSGGEGWSMTGGWFERYRIMQSYIHGLVKS